MLIPHTIINQLDRHITDTKIRDEIVYALDRDLSYTYFDGVKIDIVSDKKMKDGRVTLVFVDGVQAVQ